MSHLNKGISSPGKITPEVEAEILSLARAGKTSRAIAAWLTSHGTPLSHVAVGNVLRRSRGDLAAAAQAVVRERIAKDLGGDLDRVDEQLKALCEVATQAREVETLDPFTGQRRPDWSVYFKAVTELRKWTELRLKYSGAGEPDAPAEATTRAAADRVIERLRTLAAKQAPAPAAEPEPPAVH